MGRNWTNEETLLFVEILIDEGFNFEDCLERRALKRSANEEVYKATLQLFQEEMNKEEFQQRNAKNFGKEKYEPLQVDVKKLQAKYNAIKRKWLKIKDQPRKGSGLAPKSDPEWYEKIDYILGDTNAELVSTSLDTSYSQEVIQNDNNDSDRDLHNDSEDDNESNNANEEDKVENV